MSNYVKLSSLLFYLLVIVLCFILGTAISGLSGVAKDQGLAGGAIIFWYGILTAIGGFLISIILVSKTNIQMIKKANWILFFSIILLFFFLWYRSTSNREIPSEEIPLRKGKTTSQHLYLINIYQNKSIV